MPALNAAIAALNTLKQNDITIVKTMQNPPNGVKIVMEAVCVMKVLLLFYFIFLLCVFYDQVFIGTS